MIHHVPDCSLQASLGPPVGFICSSTHFFQSPAPSSLRPPSLAAIPTCVVGSFGVCGCKMCAVLMHTFKIIFCKSSTRNSCPVCRINAQVASVRKQWCVHCPPARSAAPQWVSVCASPVWLLSGAHLPTCGQWGRLVTRVPLVTFPMAQAVVSCSLQCSLWPREDAWVGCHIRPQGVARTGVPWSQCPGHWAVGSS